MPTKAVEQKESTDERAARLTYTVIGFIDESGEEHIAGVVEGSHPVHQNYYDRWAVVVEAATVAEAETLAFEALAKDPNQPIDPEQ